MGMVNFADLLTEAIHKKKSRVIVGLDPSWELLPLQLQEDAMSQHSMESEGPGSRMWAIREFCEGIIEATDDIAIAFKPQIAFFERFGYMGLNVLERLLEQYEDKNFIIDCKRGDIGNTAAAYAAAYFSREGEKPAPMPCDAVTLNPLLGKDSLDPWLDYLNHGKGAFLLAKTSNPSSADFQDLDTGGRPLYEVVAQKVAEWGEPYIGDCGFSALGLVAGATAPAVAKRLREVAPKALFLVPGMKSQGGNLHDALAFSDANGDGAVFNFSRSVMYAFKYGPFNEEHPDSKYKEAARVAAEYFRAHLNEILDS